MSLKVKDADGEDKTIAELADLLAMVATAAAQATANAYLSAMTTKDNLGNPISPSSYAQTMTYNGDNTIATASFTNGVNTWTQTYTWTGGNLTGLSAWVRA